MMIDIRNFDLNTIFSIFLNSQNYSYCYFLTLRPNVVSSLRENLLQEISDFVTKQQFSYR